MKSRFVLDLVPGKDAEETANRVLQELVSLVQQLNQANIPIVVGPTQNLPEGLLPGQPVIDWRSGVSEFRIWNGSQLI